MLFAWISNYIFLFASFFTRISISIFVPKLIIDWIYYLFFVFGLIFFTNIHVFVYPYLNFTRP